MPSELPFPHHTYSNDPDEGRFELIPSNMAPPVAIPRSDDVAGIPQALRREGVVQIVLLHGTFAGDDAFGIVREIVRIWPRAGAVLKQRAKRAFDEIAGEIGNYSQSFIDCLNQLINDGQEDQVPITLFHWSGENHHLGRADGAISLLDHLLSRDWLPGERIQIWGHSHAGNLLALMTNLLGASRDARRKFFAATRVHYRNPIFGQLDLPQWDRVRQRLDTDGTPWATPPRMDLITFGTPLRYRWDVEVCDHLLHFVHHRPLAADCPAQAAMPTTLEDVLVARGGDYVQQLGIASTNFLHYLFAWRSWIVERRLQRLLQPGIRRRDWLDRLRRGQRVSLDGTSLLVDYAASEEDWKRTLAGHAVYTRHEWLPFHLREIVERLYGANA